MREAGAVALARKGSADRGDRRGDTVGRARRPHEPEQPRTPRSCSTRPPTSRRRRSAIPNMRVVPLYVRFGEESFRDHVDIGARDFYRRLKSRGRAADDVAADAAGLPHGLRGSGRLRARVLVAPVGEAVRNLPVRVARRRAGERRQDPRRRLGDGVARGGAAGARDPAAPGRRHDRRRDRGSCSTVSGARTVSSSRSARWSTCRRVAGSVARRRSRHVAAREADPLRRGRGDRPDRPCARQAEGARGVRQGVHGPPPATRPGCGSRSPTPMPPSGSA